MKFFQYYVAHVTRQAAILPHQFDVRQHITSSRGIYFGSSTNRVLIDHRSILCRIEQIKILFVTRDMIIYHLVVKTKSDCDYIFFRNKIIKIYVRTHVNTRQHARASTIGKLIFADFPQFRTNPCFELIDPAGGSKARQQRARTCRFCPEFQNILRHTHTHTHCAFKLGPCRLNNFMLYQNIII